MPVETGITNENCPVDKALNIAIADRNIIRNAKIIKGWKRKFIHSPRLLNFFPERLDFIIAEPHTFNNAYIPQYPSNGKSLFIKLDRFFDDKFRALSDFIKCSPKIFSNYS